jgi:hypothetical protein
VSARKDGKGSGNKPRDLPVFKAASFLDLRENLKELGILFVERIEQEGRKIGTLSTLPSGLPLFLFLLSPAVYGCAGGVTG